MFKVVLEYEVKTQRTAPPDPIVNRLKAWEQKTLATLQQEPGPVRYPIRWTSERQRRAFFATKGFGRGIPTKRTGKLAKAWIVEVNFEGLKEFQSFKRDIVAFGADFKVGKGGQSTRKQAPTLPDVTAIITIDNPVIVERYVTGFQQQGFHKDTGWIYAPPIIEKSVQEVETILGV